MTAKELARESAIQDIKEELKRQQKCFLSFHRNLNPIMDILVGRYLIAQSTLNPTHKKSI